MKDNIEIERIRKECRAELERFRSRINLTKSLSEVDVFRLVDLFEIYNDGKSINSKPINEQVFYMWSYLKNI